MSWAPAVSVLQPVTRKRSKLLFTRRRGSTTIDLRRATVPRRRRLWRA